MTLLELYEACGRMGKLHCDSNVELTGISRHSDQVEKGHVFFCRKGKKFDSHTKVEEVCKAKAAVVVGHQEKEVPGNYWYVKEGEEAKIAAAFYGHPSRRLRVLGITGTDGKSTTAWITTQLLQQQGYRAACLGTLGVWTGESWQDWGFTTPEPEVLQKTFAQLLKQGFSHVVMEVSSHALTSSRVEGTQFAAVGLTNLGRDHLDDYDSLESYHAAKEKLFVMQPHSTQQVRPADKEEKAYWLTGTNVKATHVEAQRGSQKINFTIEGEHFDCDFPLGGEHNLRNLETATGLLRAIGLSAAGIVKVIPQVKPLIGRWQWVENTDEQVMVDYAHTPGALHTVLSNLRPLTKGRLKVLFGCGGNRDSDKRKLMGQEAKALADQVYVTDDNPRDEDPSSIRQEILKGLNGHGVDIGDRRLAIQQAINELGADDILLIAGKGHESGQIIKQEVKEFNDVEVVKELWSQRHAG